MFHRLSRIIFSLLVIPHDYLTIVETTLDKHNDKFSDDSTLQMCIESFDIYKDKIIRTQDSQGMGAKYLNEVDLDSRQECLRLCCETDECDVFIFEEKKPGSCYLFHCGRPHDFKCKFTSHANYSSAVLMNVDYRGSAQLEEQIRRTQQEHELKSLRKLSEPASLEYAYTEAPSAAAATRAAKDTIAATTSAPIKPGCSRNQYECKTSGDCIAIYNVCDGVAQCADGSDEASDLGCPTEKPTLLSPSPSSSSTMIREPLPPPPHTFDNYPPNLPPRRNHHPPIYTDEKESWQKIWQSPLPRAGPRQQADYPAAPQYNYGSPGYIGGWDYRQVYEPPNKEAYDITSNRIIHPQNQSPDYEQDRAHIFKHKSSPSVAVEPAGGPKGNSYVSYYPPENHAAWQEGQPNMPSRQSEIVPTISPKSQQNRPIAVQQQQKTTIGPIACKPTVEESIDSSAKVKIAEQTKEPQTPKIIPAEKSKSPAAAAVHDLTAEKSVEKSKIPSKILQRDDGGGGEHEKSHEEHRKHRYMAEHLERNNRSRAENDIPRPKGAVVSLALGLTATAIMAALVACRLRVVGRRGRRGHGPYAHDADYLVNGMYL